MDNKTHNKALTPVFIEKNCTKYKKCWCFGKPNLLSNTPSRHLANKKLMILCNSCKIAMQVINECSKLNLNTMQLMMLEHLQLKPIYLYSGSESYSYNCRIFCSACFQLCSTTTGTLLPIRRPPRVTTNWLS